MKIYDEIEFNQQCAEFLGWKQNSNKTTFYVDKNDGRHIYEMHDLKFHSDWNWIHLIKDAILKTNLIDEFITTYDSVANGWNCMILPRHNNTFEPLYSDIVNTEKEAYLNIIWLFLQLDNKFK